MCEQNRRIVQTSSDGWRMCLFIVLGALIRSGKGPHCFKLSEWHTEGRRGLHSPVLPPASSLPAKQRGAAFCSFRQLPPRSLSLSLCPPPPLPQTLASHSLQQRPDSSPSRRGTARAALRVLAPKMKKKKVGLSVIYVWAHRKTKTLWTVGDIFPDWRDCRRELEQGGEKEK